jgi:hypothetical protein
MKTEKERYAQLVPLFRRAILDEIERKVGKGGEYVASAPALKAAAFAALNEICESEADPVSPMLAAAVWEAVMHVNDSAFHQEMQRMMASGTLTFRIQRGAKRRVESAALGYLS